MIILHQGLLFDDYLDLFRLLSLFYVLFTDVGVVEELEVAQGWPPRLVPRVLATCRRCLFLGGGAVSLSHQDIIAYLTVF